VFEKALSHLTSGKKISKKAASILSGIKKVLPLPSDSHLGIEFGSKHSIFE